MQMHWDHNYMLTTTLHTPTVYINSMHTPYTQKYWFPSGARTVQHWSHSSARYTVKVTCHASWRWQYHQMAGSTVCRCKSPPYPLSPTRCWRYHFSYLDSGADCGLGQCKRPAEAHCLPPSQSPRLGSRKLNPLLDSHKEYSSNEKESSGPVVGKLCPQVGITQMAEKGQREGKMNLPLDSTWIQIRAQWLCPIHEWDASKWRWKNKRTKIYFWLWGMVA